MHPAPQKMRSLLRSNQKHCRRGTTEPPANWSGLKYAVASKAPNVNRTHGRLNIQCLYAETQPVPRRCPRLSAQFGLSSAPHIKIEGDRHVHGQARFRENAGSTGYFAFRALEAFSH